MPGKHARKSGFWPAVRRLFPKDLYPFILLTPTVLVVLVIVVIPVFRAVDLSFRDVEIIRPNMDLGPLTLVNYEKLLAAPRFWSALGFSLIYTAFVSLFSYLIGIGTAVLLNQKFHGRRIARLLIVLPWAVPVVVATNIFWWLFNNTYGINALLMSLGLIDKTIDWFLNPVAAMVAVITTTVWKGYPFFTIMLLAALQAIPHDLYDAAKVDGANPWQAFRRITLPALRSVTGIALLINALWAFREFTIIYVLTGGGPVGATQTLSIMTYLEAFDKFEMGYASAIGVITLVISVIGSIFFVRLSSSEFY
jgi:multiple sugar transport system permease protein